jgi:hypothetical protein
MKRFFLMCLVALMTTFFVPNIAEAKKINLNEFVTSTGGCKWTITGWIDVGFFPPSINHYDVWVTDCHGNKTHFVGMRFNPDKTNENIQYADFEKQYEIIFAPVPDQLPHPSEIFDIIQSIVLNPKNKNE